MSNGATAVTAWIAFGISVVTLAWKFIETYIRWPRIGVVMRGHITIHVTATISFSAEAFGRAELTQEGEEAPAPDNTTPDEPKPEPPPAAATGARAEEKFDVIVVNKGAEAITIANVGLRSADRSRNIDVQLQRDQGKEIDGPDFPVRVEGHGALRWVIGSDLMNEFPRGTKLIGYAYRYRAFRKYPRRLRNPLKLYETPIEYTKN
jgi:hypothetical protein